ncbi:uncharacterized protein LOC125189386 [Salvia hispanica]|uniref:uncharacterized protein LOC125189386 n=1 Tax=Salvia hispanica TaxID=49212 RepID=UPI002009AFA2|nr:uncharacterized protein LOC125189386 [Salvia hispanica]
MASGSGSRSGSGSGSGAGGSGASDWRQIVRDELRAVTSREINRALQAAMQQQQQPAVPRPVHRRTYIPRDHIAAHHRLYADYFAPQSRMREDAVGRPGHTPIQKCTSAIRQLAYGGTADMFDEYLHIGETTAREFLEVVADYRLWIWHAYFEVVGSNNDINVLQSSPLFNDQELGVGPAVSFVANGNQHNMGYYLADGIYPMWPVFVKTIRCATEDKKKFFAGRQEVARKDVERAFGVLQSRWAILRGPSWLWDMETIADVMYACIIMHNMIVEDEGPALTEWADDDGVGPSHGVATSSACLGVPQEGLDRVRAFADMRQRQARIRLQNDIIEELWLLRGGR